MIHQYKLNGYNIVLDVCSGAVHCVDEVAYDVIGLYEDHTADEIVSIIVERYAESEGITEADVRECLEDVEALKQMGKLYTPDIYADKAFDFKNRHSDIKALCLVTHIFLYKLPRVMVIVYKMLRACGSPMTADAYDVMTEPAMAVKRLEKLMNQNGWSVKELEN